MSNTYKSRIRNGTLLAGSALSVLAVTIVSPALPSILAAFKDVPNAELLVRLVMTTPALFIAIGAPLAGFLLDRLGRKPVLIAGLAVYSVSGSAGFFLDSLFSILISRAILGLAIAAIMSGFTTLIIDYFKGANLNRFMGYQSAAISFGGMGFLFFGGILADSDWRLVFLVHLFAVAVLLTTILTVNEPERGEPVSDADSSRERSVVPYGTLGLIYLTTFFSMLVFFIFPLQVPFYLQEASNIKSSLIGLALSIQGLMAAIIAFQYAKLKQRLSFQGIFFLIFLFFGVNHLVLSFTNGYSSAIIALAIGGLGIGLLPANINVWLASVVPVDIRGSAIGGLTMSLFFGQFMTPLLSQPFVAALGLNQMFLVFGIFSLAAAAVYGFAGLKGQG